MLETAKIGENQYWIPLAFSSRALFYRKDLIDTPPTNWDELFATAEKVKKENPDIMDLRFQPISYQGLMSYLTLFIKMADQQQIKMEILN